MKAQLFGNKKVSARGVGTLEVLIAFAILTLMLTAVIMVVFSNQSISIDSQTNMEALSKAELQLEAQRAQARQDFSLVQSSGPTQDGIYQKSITVQSIDTFTKQITSLVSWSTGGRSLAVKLVTLLTDFGSIGNSCNPIALGDWKNPQHWDFVPTDIIPGNNSNGLGIADMKVYKQKLYLVANFPPNSNDTVFAFSLPQDPAQSPVYLGSLDNNASSADGLNAITLGNKGSSLYGYIASAHDANFATCTQGPSCSQMQVVDMTVPASPSVVYSLKIPGVTGNMTSTGQAVGKSIFYYNGYVYLGLTKTAAGPEFLIINVSNPLLPSVVGSYAVGRSVESIYVSGNYAYLATDDNTKELTILDISNKSAPAAVGSFNAPLNDAVGNNSGLGNSVFVDNSGVYLGRTYSLSNNDPEFYILNGTSPASVLPVVGSKDIGVNGNTDSVLSIQIRSTLAFVMTGKQFQVWDIANPGSPTPWSSDGTANSFLSLSALGGSGTSFSCSSNYFYTAVASSQGQHKDILSVIGPGGIAPSMTFAVHDASHNEVTTAVVGETLHASAALSGTNGTPTGSATFTYYSGNACGGNANALGSITLASGLAEPSSSATFSTAGTYSFKAHYNGNYAYSQLDSSCVPVVVAKGDQTISVTTHAPASATYGTTFTVAAGASSGLAVALTTTGGCSIAGNTVTMTSGTTACVVHYNQAGNANYNPATEVIETATAVKAVPIITWSNPANISYGTALGATQLNASSGGVPGTFTYTPLAGTVLNVGNAQTLSVQFVPTVSANYSTPADKVVLITVQKANQTITFGALGNKVYGAADFAVSATANSGLSVSFASLTSGVCTVSGTSVHIVSVGTCTIRASQAGSGSYNAAANVDQSFSVTKATPTMSSVVYNGTTNVPVPGAVNAGTPIYEKVTLSGSTVPTGTVSFILFKNLTCNGGGGQQLQVSSQALNGSGVANSNPNFTTTSGNKNLSYQATYPGDTNYNSVTSCKTQTVN